MPDRGWTPLGRPLAPTFSDDFVHEQVARAEAAAQRVAELEAALRELHWLGSSPGSMNREEIRREVLRIVEGAQKGEQHG